MADQKVKDLQHVPLFAECSTPELQSLARNADEVDLAAGRTLITQGKPNHTFFVLLDGEVDVVVAGQEPVRRGRGEIIGEISMLDRGPATATVITTSPVRALVMSHAQFQNAITGNESIALKVIAVMARRLRQVP